MSIEIEAKMRLTDRAAVERRLQDLGAKAGPAILEQNTYFDNDDRQLKSTDQGLRLRVERIGGRDQTPTTTLTYKGPRAHGRLKSRTETEVVVGDARAAAELLAALGYLPLIMFEKRRQRWELEGCRIEIDTVPHLGEFIEIEGASDEAVLRVRERLGLADMPLIRASYVAMLVSCLRENHMPTHIVRLAEEGGE